MDSGHGLEGQGRRTRRLGSLTHQIVQDLGKAIVSIVREAVKVLNSKGMPIARPRRGTTVRP